MNQAFALPAALCVAGALVFGLAQAQTSPTGVDVKKGSLTPEQVASIQKVLADAKPDTYSFSYARDGQAALRVGSASMRDLSTVRALSLGSAGGTRSFSIISEGVNVKIITKGFGQLYPEKVRQINAILEKSAAQ